MMYYHTYAYSQVQNQIDDFYKMIVESGIDVPPCSNIESAFLQVWDKVDKFNKGIYSLSIDEYDQFRVFTGVFNVSKWIDRVKSHPEFNKLKNHIKLISSSQFIQSMTASDDNSRKFFEFVIALNLLRFVDEIDVDDPTGSNGKTKIPDIRFRINSKWYAIECKCISTTNPEGIFSKITEASEQITEYKTDKFEIQFGIPMLSVSGQKFYDGLFPINPFANYLIPLNEFQSRVMRLYSVLQASQYGTELEKTKYAKAVNGIGLFANLVTKIQWGINQFATTDLKFCDYFEIKSDPRENLARKIIKEISHQIQLQDFLLYDWKNIDTNTVDEWVNH